MIAAAWIALFSPAAAVLVLALAGTRITRRQAGVLASASVLVSLVASAVSFGLLLAEQPEERSHQSILWAWLSAGDLRVAMEILVDPLAVFEMLVVSGVGFLIVSYAVGYMHDDDEERRYHAYKALFVFSMLLLVQSGNLLLLLAGWGLVGLSSYLLINYWHQRRSAVEAGKKAFIMNAVGDATFALALFLLIQQVGALDFATVFAQAPEAIERSSPIAVLVALGLLGGAVAKSAQVPLHTWLPDAMEGPTPVSALIHAATMVTAGVYLLARTHVLFELAPAVLHLAAVLGGITLLLAGLVALVQNDIKRIIAYSTMSQIGLMFVGAGLGAYSAGMFQLMTHAFFKALLFMAAGIVIHALLAEQDIRRMGGLGRELPRTHKAFVIGALALAGLPPFAGFFSKDTILAHALAGGALGVALWAMAVCGIFLTALYTFRMVFVVFGREMSAFARERASALRQHGEAPFSMSWTVGVLAVLSLVGGLIQIPGAWSSVEDWLHPVAPSLEEPEVWMEVVSPLAGVAVALLGVGLAWSFWGRASDVPAEARRRWPWAAGALEQKLYFDEAYDLAFYEPSSRVAVAWNRFVEDPLFLRPLDRLGRGVQSVSSRVASAQTGFVRSYVLALAAGLAVMAVVFISVR